LSRPGWSRVLVKATGAVFGALVGVLLLVAGVGAQRTVPAGEGFRAEAEPDRLGRRGPAIVGWLYNDRDEALTNVRVRADALDGAGQAVGSGEAYVYGSVPARGRAYFFVPVTRYAETYRISVVRFDRVEMR
jgi:hypothetical protein